MKAVVIGDPLVASQTLVDAAKQLKVAGTLDQIVAFEWHSDLRKEAFQEKIQLIEQHGPEAVAIPEGILAELVDADYLLCHYAPVSREMIAAGSSLKLVGTCRGGLENVNLEALKEYGVEMIHVIRNAEPVAEFTLGLMLAETRNIVRANQSIKAGQWRKEFSNDSYKTTLKNQTIGIVGAGYIGKLVIKKLLALGAHVIYHDPFVSEASLLAEGLLCHSYSLEELCREADILSLHMRVSDDTRHLIDREIIALMKENAYIINTARAEIMEEEALIEALRSRSIAGAALDVVWQEPLSIDDPLVQLDNITLTTHIAGDTYDAIPGSPYLLVTVINDYLAKGVSDMLIK